MAAITKYFEKFTDGDTTVPTKPVQKTISELLDVTTENVVNDLLAVLRASPEHQARIQELNGQPRTAGPFRQSKVILQNASQFEQMAAISDFLGQRQIRNNHTFFLDLQNDEHLPVGIKKIAGIPATAMHVVLGSTRGAYKAPQYTNWAINDPRNTAAQKLFIDPLEALEMVRQPVYSAATVLKTNAFKSNQIDADHRYGLEYACVEGKGQSRYSPKKIRSAGLNACTLVDSLSDATDPTAEEVNIALPVQYEDYTDDGYADDVDLSVTPGKVMKAVQTAREEEDDSALTRLMENLTITTIGVPRTPMLCQYIADKILENDGQG